MTTHLLQAQDLTVGYCERIVLRQLQLEIPPGRVTAIIGAAASGKSTLLHALARLRRPQGGQVLLDGADGVPGRAESGGGPRPTSRRWSGRWN